MYNIEILKRKNSRTYSPVKQLATEKEVVAYMKENKLVHAGTPYLFTHIKLSDGSIITQNYNGIMCSPIKLNNLILKQ